LCKINTTKLIIKVFSRLLLTFSLVINVFCTYGTVTDTISTIDSTLVDSVALTLNDTAAKDSIQKNNKKKTSGLETEVIYFARDSIRFDVVNKKTYLFGKAEIKYEKMNLKAGYIIIDWDEKTIYAEGVTDSTGKLFDKPVFIDEGQEYKCGTMKYNFITKKGKIFQVFTKEGEGYIHGTDVKKNADEGFYIRDGKYTTCNHDENPHFYIKMSRLKVIPNNKIVCGPAYLSIADVPTPLAIPFGIFPNKTGRKSGIVIPAYGESNRLGFYLRNGGYYFAISDNIDLKLKGDIYSKGSWGVKTTSIYKRRYHYNGSFNLNYARNKTGEKTDESFKEFRDFRIRWDHRQDPKARPHSTFNARVDAGSKTFLDNNSYNTQDFLKNSMNSSINYNWRKNKYSFTSNLRHNQNLQTRQVSFSLPDVAFNVSRFYPLRKKERVGKLKWYEEIGLAYTINAKNKLSTYDSTLFQVATIKEFQNGIKHSIPIRFPSFKAFKYINVAPSFNYNGMLYPKAINKVWNVDSARVEEEVVTGFHQGMNFNGGISASTTLFGMLNFKGKRLMAIRHVMKPKLDFTYHPDFGKEFWGYYKTVQVDTIGATDRYSIFEDKKYSIFGGPPDGESGTVRLNLRNNLEMKIRQFKDTTVVIKKVKLLEQFNLSSSYNIAAKEFNMSAIRLFATTRLFDKISMKFGSSFDPYSLDSTATRINKFEFKENKRIGRLTSSNLALNYSFNPQVMQKLDSYKATTRTEAELEMLQEDMDYYVDFDIPWNINLYYKLDVKKNYFAENNIVLDSLKFTQTLNFNGELKLTDKWKIQFDAGYDFKNKKFGYSSFNFYRDLHCWEMRFRWIPFGNHKSYEFTINAKSSILQDLKWQKRQNKYDY